MKKFFIILIFLFPCIEIFGQKISILSFQKQCPTTQNPLFVIDGTTISKTILEKLYVDSCIIRKVEVDCDYIFQSDKVSFNGMIRISTKVRYVTDGNPRYRNNIFYFDSRKTIYPLEYDVFESIRYLSPYLAQQKYGSYGKKGVFELQTTKEYKNRPSPSPQIVSQCKTLCVLDGLKLSGNDIDDSSCVHKLSLATQTLRVKQRFSDIKRVEDKDTFTCCAYATSKWLVVINGQLLYRKKDKKRELSKVKMRDIQNISCLYVDEAMKQYGKLGKYGAMIITTKYFHPR